MEERLAELNSVIGVRGSFVCGSDGQVLAQVVPDSVQAEQVALVARLIHQTFRALSASGQRVSEMDLLFGNGRLILKNLRRGVLVILCARTINVPLVNLTANVVAKKLSAELKAGSRSTASTPRRARLREAPPLPPPASPEPAILSPDNASRPTSSEGAENEPAAEPRAPNPELTPTPVAGGPLSKRMQRWRDRLAEQVPGTAAAQVELQAPIVKRELVHVGPTTVEGAAARKTAQHESAAQISPELAEQDHEACRLIQSASESHLTLRALGTIAVHWHCHHPHPWLRIPSQYYTLEFCGLARDSDRLVKHLPSLGYQPNNRFNTFYANRRLTFEAPSSLYRIQIFLDVFEMYHRLNVSHHLRDDPRSLPPTLLFLTRLQAIDITEDELRELSALCLDHELEVNGGAPDKISLPLIQNLCADDWGWYKTAERNLNKLKHDAVVWLDSSERVTLDEWIERLSSSIEKAPKSLRWRMRALAGDSSPWYLIPESPNSSSRPDSEVQASNGEKNRY